VGWQLLVGPARRMKGVAYYTNKTQLLCMPKTTLMMKESVLEAASACPMMNTLVLELNYLAKNVVWTL